MTITKRERYWNKVKHLNELTYEQVLRIPDKHKHEYIAQKLRERYNKDFKLECMECALVLLYDLSGEITDDELVHLRRRKNGSK